MSKPDDDSPRFVHVPLPRNPSQADIEAFVEGIRRLARESQRARAVQAQAAEDDAPPDNGRSE